MKRFIYGAMIALTATAFLSSCEKEKPVEPVTLNAPTLAVVDQTETSFMVIWEVVENAVSYTYIINDGAEESTVNQSAEFTDLAAGTYTVKVKAIAPEGDEYLDSQWASIDVTLGSTEPEPEQLAKPELSIASQDETSFVIEWGEVANAESYAYTLNDGEETATAELSAEFTDLTAGDYTVKVKAVGDGENYLDSDWASINVTIESGDEPEPEDPEVNENLKKWLGEYTLTSTERMIFSKNGNSLGMAKEATPMSVNISIEPMEGNPEYVLIYGLSQLEGYPLVATYFTDQTTGSTDYLGILTEEVVISKDSEGNDMVCLPVCEIPTGFTFVTGCPYAFIFDYSTMTSIPYSGKLSSGAEFKAVAADVFGIVGQQVSIYHSLPSELPAGTFTLTKGSSTSLNAFSRNVESFKAYRGSAFGIAVEAAK